jgi:LysR family transcriptional activator of nhaA
MKNFNYNHLFNFYVIAKAGSLKAAAFELNLSQSTLSEQMKILEAAIQKQLFSRAGRSLSLSVEGRRLYEKVENFFGGISNLTSNEVQSTLLNQEPIEIGITTAISRVFTYEILRPIFQKTGSFIRITESTGDDLLMLFKRQKIDIFLTHEKLSKSLIRRLKSVSLKRPELLLVGGAKFETLLNAFPKDLNGQPFFLFSVRSQLRWEIEKFFKTHKIIPVVKAEVDDPELIKAAVIDQLGLAILPEYSVKKEIKEKKIFTIGKVPSSDLNVFAHYMDTHQNTELENVIKALGGKFVE